MITSDFYKCNERLLGFVTIMTRESKRKTLLEGIGPNIQSIDAYLLSDASNYLYKINDEKR